MNLVKYYRRQPDGRVDVQEIRTTQTKREIHRFVKTRPTIPNPRGGTRRIPPKYPTVAMANRAMLAQGWTRTRLWTHLGTPSGGPAARGGEGWL